VRFENEKDEIHTTSEFTIFAFVRTDSVINTERIICPLDGVDLMDNHVAGRVMELRDC